MTTVASSPCLTLDAARAQFPALQQQVRGHQLVYLDSAATALKPQVVIDAVQSIYSRDCANIHRGVHLLSQRATQRYEGAREIVRRFIGAARIEEVIFVRGATEAINLVARTWGDQNLKPGDEIVLSGLEHHSNIVPWQMLCQRTGASIRVAALADDGSVGVEAFARVIGARTRLVALAQVSNALGTILPVAEVVELARAVGARVLVDGAQGLPHLPVNVQSMGCDFYVASGHKAYGPSGIGLLWGRHELLSAMPPYEGGGDMIRTVTFEETTYAPPPARFEAGTPNISGAVGLGAALEFIESIGHEALMAHEHKLLALGTELLAATSGVRLIGTAAEKLGVLSFVVEGVHPHDLGTIADMEGVAIRTGHHCAQPVMDRFGLPATARASLGLYNTEEDLHGLVRAVHRAQEMFNP
jgi:cysteine desulfurase/selenocysteine lyase